MTPGLVAGPPDYRQVARNDARKYGVPEEIFLAQIGQESGFDPNAHSGAGADGIAQFIPSTAASYGLRNTRDPIASLDAAARYDRDLLKKYGTTERMLSAYNSGRPDAYLDQGFAKGQTYNYVRSILRGGGAGAGVSSAAALTPAPAPTGSLAEPLTTQRHAFAQELMGQIGSGKVNVQGSLQALRAPQGPSQPSGGGFIGATGPGSPGGQGAVEAARSQLGMPYQYGGPAKLGQATDCSGLLQAAWAKVGVSIPRTTYEQWKTGTPVDVNQLQAGDAVFFHMGKNGPEHVGIYVGGGHFIDDPHTGATVRMNDLAKYGGFVGARRYGGQR